MDATTMHDRSAQDAAQENTGSPRGAAEADALLALDARVNAPIYTSLPLVATRAQGVWIWDLAGKRYLDMMSAYSAVSFGHAHPRLLAALTDQASRLSVTSRAMHSDQLAPFLATLVDMTGQARALPMNSGAEAVETAIKAVRKWGHTVKGIPDGQAEIIVFDGNFHGRTTSIVSFSSHPEYRAGFGPLTPGFVSVPYGDIDAVRAAITPRTCAVLVEPIQGEGGVNVPPPGFLAALRALCDTHDVMLVADEIQTGLGRTGAMLACDHEGVRPDAVCLGKALGGGFLPVSAVVGSEALMTVFRPGDHGSTFGGNALAARVGHEALQVLRDEGLCARAEQGGALLVGLLRDAAHPLIADIRGKGLMIGVQFVASVDAEAVCHALMDAGIVTKVTHHNTIRLSPPLAINDETLQWAVGVLLRVLNDFR
ncbi:ornithine--oxo-acid transaminase [Robbsia andropogonis]|uniref:ornithine--oxo-acid transaminase n=1 Tax=Robbsia andropogonis TaxID=28092 RepID=UPI000AEF47EE|nr:ornithine--oxo-acid transaminase [Robbsia andropogonis]MCP1118991.1 ornithine--oxo-acid transaminase [Robbsia andropogonis]MCP1128657.1 ornithine--oxo-acid transaminase [Robbsia andropogonis]